ncbi:hypothetical protein H4582DRAFT_2079110 [Lactarius indigo]|nr:hypothetical protein H4582DRAFT_2079110 [Lactarius indigo]
MALTSKILPGFNGKYKLKGHRHVITINTLPDNVLLDIFEFYQKVHTSYGFTPAQSWHKLVHVCQRWRQIVFGSPCRLDLHVVFTNGTRGVNLDIWPPFPIAIQYSDDKIFTPHDEDILFAALEHRGHIRHLDLSLTGPQLEDVAAVMQEPLPSLTHLTLRWQDQRPDELPSGFLGGSAPSLQHMHLAGVHVPALHSFLSSTSNLVDLHLTDIPDSGYISPVAVVASLAMLLNLESFLLEFQSTTSNAERLPLIPQRRTLLPSLTHFQFRGDDKYLEKLVSLIDSPQLNQIYVEYLDQFLHFQVEQFFKFIDRSEDPALTLIKHADIIFTHFCVALKMYSSPEDRQDWSRVSASVHCQRKQVPHMAQVFGQSFALPSRVVHLKLLGCPYMIDPERRHNELLLLLHRFSAVRTLHMCRVFTEYIALTLEDITGDMVTKVLPVLDLVYLDGQPASSIERFLAARQLSDRPITVIDTEAEFYERVKSYVSG